MLCLRLNNWPVQRQQSFLPADQQSRIAIYSPAPADKPKSHRTTATQADLRFAREVHRAARGGAATICVSDAAWADGIRPGMPLAEARSMATPIKLTSRGNNPQATSPETHFIEWKPDEDRSTLTELAELTRQFAPIVGIDESPVPDSLLLDVSGCGRLFGGESVLAEYLVRRFLQQGYRCRAVICDSIASSWAFAHVGGHLLQEQSGGRSRIDQSWFAPTIIIPPGQSRSYLEPFPLSVARLPNDDIQVLSQLGILTLKQFFGLPVEDLPSRLSDEAIRRLRQITGVEEELIESIPEANPVSATWASEFAATNRNEVRQVVQHLVDEIEQQLLRRTLGAIRLKTRLKYEDETIEDLQAEVVKPVQKAKDLFDVLSLRLESLSLRQPVLSIRMKASVAPLPVARQKDLFSTSEHLEPLEELTTVVNRLNNRLGAESVLTVSTNDDPAPEKSVVLTPIMESYSTEARHNAEQQMQEMVTPESAATNAKLPANRPLFLLPKPVEMLCKGDRNGPLEFPWAGQNFRIAHRTGPERIQTQWWHDQAVHRDYFHVQTTTGSEFWIFQELTSQAWFIHGIFE